MTCKEKCYNTAAYLLRTNNRLTEIIQELEEKENENMATDNILITSDDELGAMHKAFMNSGFTSNQSFQLIQSMFITSLCANRR